MKIIDYIQIRLSTNEVLILNSGNNLRTQGQMLEIRKSMEKYSSSIKIKNPNIKHPLIEQVKLLWNGEVDNCDYVINNNIGMNLYDAFGLVMLHLLNDKISDYKDTIQFKLSTLQDLIDIETFISMVKLTYDIERKERSVGYRCKDSSQVEIEISEKDNALIILF